MSETSPEPLSPGQEDAIRSLLSVARLSRGALTVDLDYQRRTDADVEVRVWLSSASLPSAEQGIPLEEWEPIDVFIPEGFPLDPPIAASGRCDFVELPHQAFGSGFCVRVSPSDWDPSAGMPGFLQSLIGVYRRIALGTLEGQLRPWRPPDSYPPTGCVVIKADLPHDDRATPGAFLRWAVGVRVGDDRIDVAEWLGPGGAIDQEHDLTSALSGELERVRGRVPGAFLIPAAVLPKPIAFEYFNFIAKLLVRLRAQDMDGNVLLSWLVDAMAVNRPPGERQEPDQAEPGMMLFRSPADTRFTTADPEARFAAAWLTPADSRLLTAVLTAESDSEAQEEMRRELTVAPVRWAQVYDGRPETVWRRETGRAAEKLAGSRVLVLGCGGLGAPIAEHCVRAGAARVHVVDSATVSPGILVRQPYEDADIGKPKAEVLARRLDRIRPETTVTALEADVLSADVLGEGQLDGYDLIIDATANRSVATKLERSRRDQHSRWPALVTVAISQRATAGVAAVTPRGSVGAGVDLLRRLGLETLANPALADIYAEFFPRRSEKINFQPEPGCSDSTFIGSATDISALAAQLLDGALTRLESPAEAQSSQQRKSLSITRLGRDGEAKPTRVVLDITHDRVVSDSAGTYQLRLDEPTMEIIRRHIVKSAGSGSPGSCHTGGLLLGQFDDACQIVWVSRATSLPPGSTADPLRIELNVPAVRDYLRECRQRSGGMRSLVGFWHTHPGGAVTPSRIDRDTMQGLIDRSDGRLLRMLLLVLGLPGDGFDGQLPSPWYPAMHAEVFTA
jgi:proteasome lid subunit RPN8/RPN11